MSEGMNRLLAKVLLVFALLNQIPDFVCSQKYVIRIRNNANLRSYGDPTVLKVYPGVGQKYSDEPDIAPDAGVPPDADVPPKANIPPVLAPESGSYDKPTNKDYPTDSITQDSGDKSYEDDRGKNLANDEVVCHFQYLFN